MVRKFNAGSPFASLVKIGDGQAREAGLVVHRGDDAVLHQGLGGQVQWRRGHALGDGLQDARGGTMHGAARRSTHKDTHT